MMELLFKLIVVMNDSIVYMYKAIMPYNLTLHKVICELQSINLEKIDNRVCKSNSKRRQIIKSLILAEHFFYT